MTFKMKSSAKPVLLMKPPAPVAVLPSVDKNGSTGESTPIKKDGELNPKKRKYDDYKASNEDNEEVQEVPTKVFKKCSEYIEERQKETKSPLSIDLSKYQYSKLAMDQDDEPSPVPVEDKPTEVSEVPPVPLKVPSPPNLPT